MAIRVMNTGSEPYTDKFNGERYVIGPGEVAVIPDGAAALWLGVPPDNPTPDERRRAAFRRGGRYPSLVVVPETAAKAQKSPAGRKGKQEQTSSGPSFEGGQVPGAGPTGEGLDEQAEA